MIRRFESRLRSFSFRTNLAACQNGRPLPARRRRSRQSPRQLRADAGRPLHRFRASSGRTPDVLAITVAASMPTPPSPSLHTDGATLWLQRPGQERVDCRTPSPSPSPSRSSVPYRLIDLPPPARRHAPRTDEHLQESRSVSDSWRPQICNQWPDMIFLLIPVMNLQ